MAPTGVCRQTLHADLEMDVQCCFLCLLAVSIVRAAGKVACLWHSRVLSQTRSLQHCRTRKQIATAKKMLAFWLPVSNCDMQTLCVLITCGFHFQRSHDDDVHASLRSISPASRNDLSTGAALASTLWDRR